MNFVFETVFFYITLQFRGNNADIINMYIITMRNALMQSKQKGKILKL